MSQQNSRHLVWMDLEMTGLDPEKDTILEIATLVTNDTLEGYLHYRIVDVSTIKELVRRWYPHGPQPPEKRHAHLALDDLRESITELRFYRQNYFRAVDH